jgi:hypothetical protein
MNYLYYSIFTFYTKIIKIQNWGDSPHFYCSGLISVLESMLFFSILDFYLIHNYSFESLKYSKWIPIISTILLFAINHYYFKYRKEELINNISKKTIKKRRLINMISLIIVLSIISLFLYSGGLN